MHKCKIIGLTGQSGAGKSTVANYYKSLGAFVFNADDAVRKIYESGSACLNAVAARFGRDIINPDKSLNRKLLAQRAFSSPEETAALNSIVHPFVTAELFSQIKRYNPRLLILDAPQLFEGNLDVICDGIISVISPENMRLNRICQRDGLTAAQAKQRINAQHDEYYFMDNSDFVIINDSDKQALLKRAKEIYDIIS